MSINELVINTLKPLNIPITAIQNSIKNDKYIVLIPLYETFDVYADNKPTIEIQEVQLAIYCKGNYLALKKQITTLLIDAGFIITNSKYIEYEEDTKLHHYVIDTAVEFCY